MNGERLSDKPDPCTFYDLEGTPYQDFLRTLHAILRPKTYFEVGTLGGDTLKIASCASISVDPSLQLTSEVIGQKPSCHFFQIGSDEFFRRNRPSSIFGQPIDLAFLDGMHLFEFLLRDFMNTEQECRKNSIVALHDCVPGDVHITVRSPSHPDRQKSSHPGYWTGDVWKVLPILQEWRPDLKVVVADAPPTGLVLITNLEPASRILRDSYQEIVDRYAGLNLADYGIEKFYAECEIVSTATLSSLEGLAPLFWL